MSGYVPVARRLGEPDAGFEVDLLAVCAGEQDAAVQNGFVVGFLNRLLHVRRIEQSRNAAGERSVADPCTIAPGPIRSRGSRNSSGTCPIRNMSIAKRSAELQAPNFSQTEFSDLVRKDLRVPDKIQKFMRGACPDSRGYLVAIQCGF